MRVYGVESQWAGRAVRLRHNVARLPVPPAWRWLDIVAGLLLSPLLLISGRARTVIALLLGRLSIAGPRPRSLDCRRESGRVIGREVPGMFCLWWIRRRGNVDYGTEEEADLEFLERRSLASHVGVVARAAVATLYGSPDTSTAPVSNILGLNVDNLSLEEAAAAIASRPRNLNPLQVSFLNADCVNLAMRDAEYRDILCASGLRLGDGIGLKLAGKLLRSPIRQNVNGTDLFPVLCRHLEQADKSVYLLGGRPGVADAVAGWIGAHYSSLRVAGRRDGYFQAGQEADVIASINRSNADVLLVALGAPRQERWISRSLAELDVTAALGVGGLFDFYSGNISRAPRWLREIGMEWTWRLYQEPGRMWKRYLLGNAIFLARVLAARLHKGMQNTCC